MRTVESYPWPGNVRELKKILERAVLEGVPLPFVIHPRSRNSRVLTDEFFNTNVPAANAVGVFALSPAAVVNVKIRGTVSNSPSAL